MPLSPEQFSRFAQLLRTLTGVAYSADAHRFMQRKLTGRLEALRLESFEAYFECVLHDAEEQNRFIDSVTTHESYFFREHQQVIALERELLPRLAQAWGQDPNPFLRAWSAGCANGCEAYTLSMLLAESGSFEGFSVDILGTDISAEQISRARAALYNDSALRETSAERRMRHFDRADDGWRVVEPLRGRVRFEVRNLLTGPLQTPQQLILCRNVMIYLDAQARRRLVDLLFRSLMPGGYLLLGHAENLLPAPGPFECVRLENDLVYQRPANS